MSLICKRIHRFLLITAAVISVSSLLSFAQQTVSAPRNDGRSTPMLVYKAAGTTRGCAPLAIISHGAGGSEHGYRYLAEAMSQNGFTTIVMGHRESGIAALRSDIRADGFREGITALVTDPSAEQARLMDVGAALRWAETQCDTPFRVLLGHSMGAITVMLESGARNIIGVKNPPAGQDRFDAYVALSPEGPGLVFPEHAWNGIRKPMLILTGTRDQSLKGGPKARLIPWNDLPGNEITKCQWMGVIDGATHMNFGGGGLGASTVTPLITQTITNFLIGVRADNCKLPKQVHGFMLQAK